MFKVLLYSFSMYRHKLYPILSITKNVPCFVLLITGYFNVLYYTGKNCSGFRVYKSVFRSRYTILDLLGFYINFFLKDSENT